ncbi:DUF3108 domain-containing protein [Shewanella avicenniae]|uniref:DUF3108 domain-containing protein n=1 Tax=Shewanella avicenniae TaxID=2814294 RepID=A0ABX7QXV1_9GAMM|nr:DUF3108 domain-containing protein [Shewanella avicenniae]
MQHILACIALWPLSVLADHNPLEPQIAEYHVQYGSIGLGDARFVLDAPQDNTYKYEMTSKLSLLVVSDEREITSEFSRNGDQLIPNLFEHKRTGTGSDFTEQIRFAKELGKVFTVYKAKNKTLDYQGTLYDAMMVQLQFRLDLSLGKPEFAYDMVKDNKFNDYRFHNHGVESVIVEGHKYQAVKLEVQRDTDKRRTVVWMAPDLGYLPVKFIHQKKGDSALQLTLTRAQFGSTTFSDDLAEAK